MSGIALIQLPSPPGRNIFREWAGGMGTALASTRQSYGHDRRFYDVPYSSFLYLAQHLRDLGMAPAYRDFQAETELALEQFDAAIAQLAPRVVVTQVNLPSLTSDCALLARIRAAVPGARILLLGAASKWFAQRLLADGLADAIMQESEEWAGGTTALGLFHGDPALLSGCAVWRDGAIDHIPLKTPLRSLDFVEFPAYDLLDFSRYESDYYLDRRYRYATVLTTKGCPYTCGYCPYPYGFGRRLIYRDPSRVAADIHRLETTFGVGQILFRDQVFTINRRHAERVCQAMIAQGTKSVWVCETRYDVVDPALLDLMYRAGCREIHFGLESGDAEIFATTAKTDGPKSLDLFADAVAQAKAAGLRVHLHCIVGMPDESPASVRNTTRFLRRVKPDSVQLAYFTPYPGTPFYESLSQSGELGDITALDWEDLGSFTGAVIPSRHMSRAAIERARHRIAVDWQFSLADRVRNRLRRLSGVQVKTA